MRATRSAAYFAGFSASVAGEILLAGYPPRPRVLICSSSQTTERKAHWKRNYATQSTLMLGLSCHDEAPGFKMERKRHSDKLWIASNRQAMQGKTLEKHWVTQLQSVLRGWAVLSAQRSPRWRLEEVENENKTKRNISIRSTSHTQLIIWAYKRSKILADCLGNESRCRS